MNSLVRVTAVESIGGCQFRLTFSDNRVRELDFEGMLLGGVFAPLRNLDYFASVGVDHVAGTIQWPNGVDLDPDVLHGDHEPATGPGVTVLRDYQLHAAP